MSLAGTWKYAPTACCGRRQFPSVFSFANEILDLSVSAKAAGTPPYYLQTPPMEILPRVKPTGWHWESGPSSASTQRTTPYASSVPQDPTIPSAPRGFQVQALLLRKPFSGNPYPLRSSLGDWRPHRCISTWNLLLVTGGSTTRERCGPTPHQTSFPQKR